ncbi:helix-turn-helix transcriptional regulator [Lactococcus lactis]|uniref:helix-turn-helix domain-containing protein n=1 Tax=Lactococcus lactis TaxID=1358 RepID=UPI00288C89D9|nr:helix-turn-helix transcriptional regulator [Lactococcus lactis]MDT2909667.1 helix-turn-helix transcriptional regulator [Lactococcus lactis]MDT2925735.1 helix-turn-helix transcriptional regulator [Lactococcus lactis]MDT2952850.1 helix-turn-helix transcriptional regulator [Lactococcus lactis]
MIKDNIKKARLKSGLTQAQVAEKLGVSQAQYARWESGGRNPKDDTLEKLAEVFGVGTDTLKGRDDGLEDIVNLLREHKLTKVQKKEIIALINKVLGE